MEEMEPRVSCLVGDSTANLEVTESGALGRQTEQQEKLVHCLQDWRCHKDTSDDLDER